MHMYVYAYIYIYIHSITFPKMDLKMQQKKVEKIQEILFFFINIGR